MATYDDWKTRAPEPTNEDNEEAIREAAARAEYGIGELNMLAWQAHERAAQAVDLHEYGVAAQNFQLAADLCRQANEACTAWIRDFQTVVLP